MIVKDAPVKDAVRLWTCFAANYATEDWPEAMHKLTRQVPAASQPLSDYISVMNSPNCSWLATVVINVDFAFPGPPPDLVALADLSNLSLLKLSCSRDRVAMVSPSDSCTRGAILDRFVAREWARRAQNSRGFPSLRALTLCDQNAMPADGFRYLKALPKLEIVDTLDCYRLHDCGASHVLAEHGWRVTAPDEASADVSCTRGLKLLRFFYGQQSQNRSHHERATFKRMQPYDPQKCWLPDLSSAERPTAPPPLKRRRLKNPQRASLGPDGDVL